MPSLWKYLDYNCVARARSFRSHSVHGLLRATWINSLQKRSKKLEFYDFAQACYAQSCLPFLMTLSSKPVLYWYHQPEPSISATTHAFKERSPKYTSKTTTVKWNYVSTSNEEKRSDNFVLLLYFLACQTHTCLQSRGLTHSNTPAISRHRKFTLSSHQRNKWYVTPANKL